MVLDDVGRVVCNQAVQADPVGRITFQLLIEVSFYAVNAIDHIVWTLGTDNLSNADSRLRDCQLLSEIYTCISFIPTVR